MGVGGQLGRATMRAAKAVTKGYSDTQAKARDATKNDPTPPTSRELDDLAHLSYSQPDFVEIMEILDKRLNDKGKLWRHVFKALAVINHLLHSGSPQVYHYCHSNLYVFKTLREFQYVDDEGKDVGQIVRSEAKEVTRLLVSPEELKKKRRDGERRSHDELIRSSPQHQRRSGEARRSGKQDENKRQRVMEDEELKQALALSKKEEEERLRRINDSNKEGLFDAMPSTSRAESSTKPKDDLLIDLSDSDNSTAPLQMQYTQMPLQTQYTAYPIQQQYTSFSQQLQPQYTTAYSGFQGDMPQYAYAAQQEAMQAEYVRQQAQWQAQSQFNQQQQQIQQWQTLLPQTTNYQPIGTQATSPSPHPIAPQPTSYHVGSNNPFAPTTSASPYHPTPSPTLSSTTTESSRMSPATPFSARSRSRASAGQRPKSAFDERYQTLEELYKGRSGGSGEEGVDTFGNVGHLRYGGTGTF